MEGPGHSWCGPFNAPVISKGLMILEIVVDDIALAEAGLVAYDSFYCINALVHYETSIDRSRNTR